MGVKKILYLNHTSIAGRMFQQTARDNINDPAFYLRQRLAEIGYSFEAPGRQRLQDCAWILFEDGRMVFPYRGVIGLLRYGKTVLEGKRPRDFYRECSKKHANVKTALFLIESPAVDYKTWSWWLDELIAKFPIIFTWNDRLVNGSNIKKFHLSLPRTIPATPAVPFTKRKLLVNISTNRHSRHPQELYTARLKTIRHFEMCKRKDFDLYGFGWKKEDFPSYQGTVRNKWDILPNYRFSICYENLAEEPGYVTEKIFDSLRCGCVPIYLGAPNIDRYVDPNAFIDRRRFSSENELETYLCNMSERQYEVYQQSIEEYLHGPLFEKFLPPYCAKTIIEGLGL